MYSILLTINYIQTIRYGTVIVLFKLEIRGISNATQYYNCVLIIWAMHTNILYELYILILLYQLYILILLYELILDN